MESGCLPCVHDWNAGVPTHGREHSASAHSTPPDKLRHRACGPDRVLNLPDMFFRRFAPLARPHGKEVFLKSLRPGSQVLDVGCGNNSPLRAKRCAPDIHYTGLDVGDYNQRSDSIRSADRYILTTPSDFSATIEALAASFDAVVSSHNLEHCAEPARVMRAMCQALKPGGRMYLSFPSEASVTLPHRKRNTLNFFDDPTHTRPPYLCRFVPSWRAMACGSSSSPRGIDPCCRCSEGSRRNPRRT